MLLWIEVGFMGLGFKKLRARSREFIHYRLGCISNRFSLGLPRV